MSEQANTQQNDQSESQPAENTRINSAVEKLSAKSGQILLIDQFMLANKQFDAFLAQEEANNPGYSVERLKLAAKNYGGSVLEFAGEDFIVERFVRDSVITISPSDKSQGWSMEQVSADKENFKIVGSVFVDTRCVALLDAEVACQKKTLSDFRKERERGGDKAGRDLVRSLGGAVRYGFNRFGDELGVFLNKEQNILALWPDVVESGEVQ